jgi:hypothetical protein
MTNVNLSKFNLSEKQAAEAIKIFAYFKNAEVTRKALKEYAINKMELAWPPSYIVKNDAFKGERGMYRIPAALIGQKIVVPEKTTKTAKPAASTKKGAAKGKGAAVKAKGKGAVKGKGAPASKKAAAKGAAAEALKSLMTTPAPVVEVAAPAAS